MALVDSGCRGVSLIHSSLADKLKLSLQNSNTLLTTADPSKQLHVLCSVTVPFKLGKYSCQHTFVVVCDLCVEVIIGTDVLIKLGCKIDFEKNVVASPTVGNVPFSSQSSTSQVVAVQHQIIIPPHSLRLVEVPVLNMLPNTHVLACTNF